jgi:acyl carrier protein
MGRAANPYLTASAAVRKRLAGNFRRRYLVMLEKIKSIVSEQLNISPDKITLESSIIDDLGADSLDVVELVMALEENFGVEIPDEEAEKISTIGDIVNYIESHKNA